MKNLDSANNNSRPALGLPPKITVGDKPPKTVDLLGGGAGKKPRRVLRAVLVVIVALVLGLGGFVVSRAVGISNKIFVGTKTSFFEKIREVFAGGSGNIALNGEEMGQVNILLLGIGGEGHDGPYLTDTMILAQIRPDTGEVTLTSIPRDYLVKLPDGSEQKINAAFALGFGKDKDWDKAGQWSRSVVEKISGLNIPYFAVIDFSGFEKAINEVGGVDVSVDRTFTDSAYPDSGTGYLPPQTFVAGPQHMDGARALIFARSRHAAGVEGSDFSRSQRQQKIIEAFKAKVFTLNLASDAGKLNSLLNIFADHFHTNIGPGQMLRLNSIFRSGGIRNFLSLSLDPATGLICPEILASNGAYVLVPCKSASDVENYFKDSFSIGKLAAEKSIVWLANSTSDKAVYNTAFRKLTNAGLTVYQLSYSPDNLGTSLVYEANPKPATVEFIENELHATAVNLPPPKVTIPKDKVDIIVVLGQNAPKEAEPILYIPPPARQASSTEQNSSTTPATNTQSSTLKGN